MAGLITGAGPSENPSGRLATKKSTESLVERKKTERQPADTTQLNVSQQERKSIYDEGAVLGTEVAEHFRSNPNVELPKNLQERMLQWNARYATLPISETSRSSESQPRPREVQAQAHESADRISLSDLRR